MKNKIIWFLQIDNEFGVMGEATLCQMLSIIWSTSGKNEEKEKEGEGVER